MNQIRAFVGHSFNEDDKRVVNTFLKFFERVEQTHPAFSWEHAELAEPKLLAEKVLRLLADKNVFIGICTRKERAIAANTLEPAWFGFSASTLKAKKEAFEWKTSDWIIQEIGLACGRGMDLILLVEGGVRQPGGLQGNVEYIAFDRDTPEKSFGKILEMIGALSPKAAIPAGDVGTSLPVFEEQKDENSSDDRWGVPSPTWKRSDYELALLRATILNQDQAQALYDAYLETDGGTAEENRTSWRAYGLYVRMVYGTGAPLADLKLIAQQNPKNSDVINYLGGAYEFFEQFIDAGEAYRAASNQAKEAKSRLRLLRKSALAYQKAGKLDVVVETVELMREISCRETTSEQEVLQANRELAEASGDGELVLAALERIVDLAPDNEGSRFDLAYKHSESGNDSLALFHYLRIPEQGRKDATWNNLGVSFERLDLEARSVDAYLQAENAGNTLAMSNLANKLMKIGFLKEARAICDKALASKDIHKNVGSSLARLIEMPESEKKREQALLEAARPVSIFYQGLGRAAARPTPESLTGTWKGPKCMLEVSFIGSTLRCTGTYEVKGALLRRFGVGAALGDEQTPVRYRVEYEARSEGCAFLGTVTENRVDAPLMAATLLGTSKDDCKVLLVLSEGAKVFQVMERKSNQEPKFYWLERISS